MRSTQDREEHVGHAEGGVTMIELMLAITFVVIGVLGFVTANITSQRLARSTKELNLANTAVVSAVEDFRESCMTDFAGALTAYQSGGTQLQSGLPSELGQEATMTGTVILDETRVSPQMDLDGSGVAGDNTAVSPASAKGAVLRLTLSWRGVLGLRTIEYTTVLANGELQ